MDVALRGTVESAGLNRLALSVWSAQAQHHPETLAYHNGFGHFKPVRAVRRCLLRQVWQCSASLPQLGPQRLPIWASACDDCLEERWPRLFGQKTFFDKWNLASCGRLTGDAVGFDLPGFYTKRIELGGACGRRDARWESRQTFPRQAARCATAHRPQIHGVPSSCLTPLLGLPTRLPGSRRRSASCHPGSDGVVARCRSVDTWPGWLSRRRRCHRP